MDSQIHYFPLLSFPPELIGRVGLYSSASRLALPVEALNRSLVSIFGLPQSISYRALRQFPSPEHALAAEAAHGNLAVLEILCRHVIHVDIPVVLPHEGKYPPASPLARATRAGHSDAVKLLFSHGATNRNFFNQVEMDYPLLEAAARATNLDFFRLATEGGGLFQESEWLSILRVAAENVVLGGTMVEAVSRFHPLNVGSLQIVFTAAATSGNLDAVKMTAERGFGATLEFGVIWREAAISAAENGHIGILNTIVEMLGAPEGPEMLSLEMTVRYAPFSVVRKLFESGRDLRPSLLIEAAMRDTHVVEVLQMLLEYFQSQNIDVEPTEHCSFVANALGAVCTRGHLDAVKYLFHYGAPVSDTILKFTAHSGQAEVLDMLFTLLSERGDVMPDGEALLLPARFNQRDTVKILLNRHPPSRAQAREALVVAERHGWADLARLVIEVVPDSFISSDHWVTRAATRRTVAPLMKVLLDLHRIGTIQIEPVKLLLHATRAGHTGATRLILRYLGKDVGTVYSSDKFWDAVQEGFTSRLAGALLGFGDVKAVKEAARRLLPIAAREGCVKILGQLLRRRGGGGEPLADIHEDDDAALFAAVEAGMARSVKVLVRYGADPGARGERAKKLAKRRKYHDIVSALMGPNRIA
ncbi:hypothetical protein M427DRAFT_51464 [Gonapodya prolifera JEL478]|uniref:Ankyrin n=1 Tax=Gonapodya prolifera (strain JEL478) TaxID=1344416 RepID=A0A139AWX5_GONPJ|nr:hypothetical protein M427DRAFT_51464 [Gonapodya prolifera JEL478]|eukprot:KXS21204.1 hypothetical protein M427DRAFT_51464 [Gonapodya prolifera JEL478]